MSGEWRVASDYFVLFGLERTFALDENTLKQKYFSLQREYHPDRADADQKMAMLQKSADINRGYQILKNPVARAEYLLGPKEEKPSQALLMEAMEQREALAEVKASAALEALRKENSKAIEDCIQSLAKKLDAQTVIKLKYLTKFAEELRVKALELI